MMRRMNRGVFLSSKKKKIHSWVATASGANSFPNLALKMEYSESHVNMVALHRKISLEETFWVLSVSAEYFC